MRVIHSKVFQEIRKKQEEDSGMMSRVEREDSLE